MSRSSQLLLALAAALFAAPGAHALCVYEGVLYYQTTLQEEFVDSIHVVHATGFSERDQNISDTSDEDPLVHYTLKVEHAYKGNAEEKITVYTHRNSGAYYFEKGRDYLVFLERTASADGHLPQGGLTVNYSCGHTKLWAKVTDKERACLVGLSEPEAIFLE